MKFFNKSETLGVLIILGIVLIVSLFNFKIALRRARDSQRREDLGAIYNALGSYQAQFGFFPLGSSDGKIKACKPDNFNDLLEEFSKEYVFDTQGYLESLVTCEWGEDAFFDITEAEQTFYLKIIPQDPKTDIGISYFYISNSRLFQIYAYLEGEEDETGYDTTIVNRNLPCGNHICNFGRAYSITPLDKSLEEYENELMEKNSKFQIPNEK
jgi:type II secretory pathway pseudopilin PulG